MLDNKEPVLSEEKETKVVLFHYGDYFNCLLANLSL